MSDRTVYIVEPHADDAYLSLGATISKWTAEGTPVVIVTVYSATRQRSVDARKYAAAVGAAWLGLGLTETNVGLGDPTATVTLPLTRNDLPYDGLLILPLGIQHPEHRAVAALAAPADLAYLDTPYQLRRKNQPEIAARLAGRAVVRWERPDWRQKFRHHDLFKDQSMFMHRNPPAALAAAVELIVR
jgi:LmbE family N-acetylglucosaminyl deacetylase